MRDGHLVADGAHFIMSGLFGFAITEAGEVTFNFCAQIECALKKGGVPWNAGTGVICDIEILGAAISGAAGELRAMDGATLQVFFGDIMGGFDCAAELGALAQSFGPSAAGSHFDAGLTDGASVRAEGFGFLLITRIDGDECLAFKFVNDEVVDFAFIVSGITDEESAPFETINALELLDELTGDFGVSGIVGKCKRDQRDAFF